MRRHTVACLAGDGLGPELMAEATRTLRKVARMHGFAIEEVHVPFGSEALTRSGHPLPPATRSAVLAADAVLVAAGGPSLGDVLGDVRSELDLRASATHVLWRRGAFTLVSPEPGEPPGWAVGRAIELAEQRRGLLVAVDHDATWAALVDEAADRRHALAVEHLSLADTMHALAFRPESLDVVASSGPVAPALEELAAGTDGDRRVVARGRLAGNGPSVFAPGQAESHEHAGHGVADPAPMLLAASLMLGEGLGERHAAATLSAALRDARSSRRPVAAVRRTLSASTRDLSDTVVRLLPSSHRNAEFLNEATG